MNSLIYLSRDITLFAGVLGALPSHVHPTSVLIAGGENEPQVCVSVGTERTCLGAQCMLIDAGVKHQIDFRNQPVVVVYPEPGCDLWFALKRLQKTQVPLQTGVWAMSDAPGLQGLLASFIEGELVTQQVEQWASDWIAHEHHMSSTDLPSSCLDSRVQKVIEYLYAEDSQADLDARGFLSRLTQAVDLSESRLSHLFSEQVGITLRLYRQWVKLRLSAKSMVNNTRLTDAAMDGGFTDSAHFANTFKLTFGLTPSAIFTGQAAPDIVLGANFVS
jgi:AraC-like DNA-binding protein